MNDLGVFLSSLAQLSREGVIAKPLASQIAKNVLRKEGLMPEFERKEQKKEVENKNAIRNS